MKVPSWLAVILLVATAQPLRAEGDPERGLAVARQVCSACHAIQAYQLQSPNERAPTFLALAKTPGMTATALTVALTTPHVGMPMFRLTTEQRDGIIAYILGLKQSGSPPGR
jgi:mono/diheme cytochrome c family protein